jgi:hypothetical protein
MAVGNTCAQYVIRGLAGLAIAIDMLGAFIRKKKRKPKRKKDGLKYPHYGRKFAK